MAIQEIKAATMDTREFVAKKIQEISQAVEEGDAINALSGGVDSSCVTMLGHKALGNRLKTYFINNGIMRENEPETIISIFKTLGVPVEVIDAQDVFFDALKGITDPEEKREAITQTFYKEVFAELVKKSNSRYLLQGTILTDVDETVAGIKRQHNVFEQLGIDPQKAFGYKIIEPLVQLRKDGVRKVAEAVGLPETIYNRMPFPGPALSARVIGEATREKIGIVKRATVITEEMLQGVKAFQYMAILHQDRVTGICNGKREFGMQVEIRCWDSIDARNATFTRLPYDILEKLAGRIVTEVPGVVSVTYNITTKPPSTMEAV
ncbi:MAG: ExsB family transcriptional regulator [Candidatus Omnitrophica bacterium]|nr:ExsB family transcriptional regulator [Candidatus Omnitrophota bacterium]